MLKSITINNYKTFTQKITFDFSASKYTFLEKDNVGSGKVLKGALFVGENASGKTNVLKAILFLLQAFSGVEFIDFMSMKSFYTSERYFSLKYTFSVDEKIIEYTVKCDASGVKEEELYFDKKRYFVRKGETVEIGERNTGADFKSGVSGNLLYLRKLYFDTRFDDSESLKKWARFLEHSVYINCLDNSMQGNPVVINSIMNDQYFHDNGTKEINEFFSNINYRQKIHYTIEAKGKSITFKNNKEFIAFEKDGTDAMVPINYESAGNKTLMAVLPVFLYATKNDCLLIVDEFSSGLHNELEECLLKYFFRKSRNSQIFFTTHSTNVLDSKILRPDQVYSIGFDGKNGSTIKRFSEHNPVPRVAQNFEHMYLNGEFDGKPYYNSNF